MGLDPGKTTENCKLTKNRKIKENFKKTFGVMGNFRKNLETLCEFVTTRKEKFYKILKNLGRNCTEFRRTFGTILEMTE